MRDKSNNLLVFVQTHNPKNPHVFSYLRNAFNSLIATNKFADIFKETILIKSLKQLLILDVYYKSTIFSLIMLAMVVSNVMVVFVGHVTIF